MSYSGTSGHTLLNNNINIVTKANVAVTIIISGILGAYMFQLKVKTCRFANPGTIIKNRSSHIPILTDIHAIDMIHKLRRALLLNQSVTGIKYVVTTKIMVHALTGHTVNCNALTAISSASLPYIPKITSITKK